MDEGRADPLVLVVGSDDRYAMPLAITLFSALRRISPERAVRVHVFDGGITEGNKTRVERVVRNARHETELEWHEMDPDRFEGLRVVRWMSVATYSRLFIPELLEHERVVVYLDSDLLVRTDLSALIGAGTNLDDVIVSAVNDFRHPDLGDALGDDNCRRLNLDPRSPYFNSGVMVINVEKWREQRVAERAVEFVRNHSSIMRYHDQDALNVVFADRWSRLDPRWNIMLLKLQAFLERTAGEEVEIETAVGELADDAFILHFIGARKPWVGDYEGLAREEYLAEVRGSGWFDVQLSWALWRARLELARAAWMSYRKLPEGLRARLRAFADR